MTSVQVVRAVREYGLLGAFKHFHKLRTFKFGTLVGVDKMGNEYFENAVEYPHGQHRWIVPPGFRSWFDYDASEVSPEWHGWLHGTTDDPPTEQTVGSVYQMEPQTVTSEPHTPYARNLGGVVTPHVINQSQRHPRGYGLGNGINTAPLRTQANEDFIYTQPGWPMDPRHVSPKNPKEWSLTDTPASLAARRERQLGGNTLKAIAAAKQRMLGSGDEEPTFGTFTADAEFNEAGDDDSLRELLSKRGEGAIRADMVLCEELIDQYSGYTGFPDAEAAVKNAGERLLELHAELDALHADLAAFPFDDE